MKKKTAPVTQANSVLIPAEYYNRISHLEIPCPYFIIMSYILSWNLRKTLTNHMYLNTDLVEITLFSYKLALIYE